ncbi:MAG: hypothetical protein BWY15_00522 [Firmicutes bacterium ADurb.Bin193]|nr:MAG: hypothetical protein BWY15_00522 [Firmicutes bacterium ADurb.Bin193]
MSMRDDTIYLDSQTRESIFNNLISDVVEKQPYPENYYEVAAVLESIGWNDSRVNATFGMDDVFELAVEIYSVINEDVSFSSFEEKKRHTLTHKANIVIKSFIRGAVFALPMAISVLSMLTLRFSLWSYEFLSVEIATCIAIGTIFSFLTVGGFMQAIARRGFLYLRQNYYNLARKITAYFIKLGYILTTLILLSFLLFNLVFEAFPYDMMIIIILYYVFLSAIWFSVTVMYILEREFTFAGLIVAGIGIVWLLTRIFGMEFIIPAQIIALLIVAAVGLILIFYLFRVAESKMPKGIEPALPKKSITLYTTFPFFAYGFLYFAFLFMDRIIGWSTSQSYMPYIIWFRGAYELGLDFALIMMVVPMGFCEVVVSKLMDELAEGQKNSYGTDTAVISRQFRRIYFRRLLLVATVSVISALVTYLVIRHLDLYPPPGFRSGFLQSYVTHFVFVIGLISYGTVCVALMNCVTLFSLSQPEMAGKSVLISLIVNIVVGFLLSRWIEYYFAVIGLFIGSVVFLVISSRRILEVFKKLDYYLYFQV